MSFQVMTSFVPCVVDRPIVNVNFCSNAFLSCLRTFWPSPLSGKYPFCLVPWYLWPGLGWFCPCMPLSNLYVIWMVPHDPYPGRLKHNLLTDILPSGWFPIRRSYTWKQVGHLFWCLNASSIQPEQKEWPHLSRVFLSVKSLRQMTHLSSPEPLGLKRGCLSEIKQI